MSKPVFEDLFTFSGRRNRKSYLLYVLTVWVVSVLVDTLIFGFLSFKVAMLIYISTALLFWTANAAVTAQRCRDFGWSGWFAVCMILPSVYTSSVATNSVDVNYQQVAWVQWLVIILLVYAVFALMLWFIPGDQGENKYGQDPLEKSLSKVVT